MRFRAWILSLTWRYTRYADKAICDEAAEMGYAKAERLNDKRVDAALLEIRKKANITSRAYFLTVRFCSYNLVSPAMASLVIPNIYMLLLPEYALKWNDETLRGVIAHEVAHIHLGHFLTSEPTIRQAYLERESQTDLKAAEWVGHSAVIAMLQAILKQLPQFRPEMRVGVKSVLEERIMLLDIDRILKNIDAASHY